MTALVCGSVAYDTIMVFDGRFTDHILPDKIHMLNVSFLVPKLRREFGGCAGNIAYNLHLLGADARILGAVGCDFASYGEWLDSHQISREYIVELRDEYTAQAYITTDIEDNQITAFHPGAMSHSTCIEVPADAGITIGIVAPEGRYAMINHARQFTAAGIPYIFDPGQGLPLFDGDDLHDFIETASWVAVNDYEAQLLEERTGLSPGEIAQKVKAVIVTRGGEGSYVYTDDRRIAVPVAQTERMVDPTGCGDAYRAGLIYGLMNDLEWSDIGRIASLMGAIKIEQHGTQNHNFTWPQFCQRYKDSFGQELNI